MVGALAKVVSKMIGLEQSEILGSQILTRYHEEVFQRDWVRQENGAPHFFPRKNTLHRLYTGDAGSDIFSLLRGFYALEMIRPGDIVLDIGCGDGGITKRFLAPVAAHVDAMDIEPSAIEAAMRDSAAPNVNYIVSDAVKGPWPRERYNVVSLDGALGHISASDSAALFGKVSAAIDGDGVFFGSESLEEDGHDHLQFFPDLKSLRASLAPFFPVIRLVERSYLIRGGHLRKEAFFRASHSSTRIDSAVWQ